MNTVQTTFLTALLLAVPAVAQGSVIVPTIAGLADGNDSRSLPFGRSAFRVQQIVDAAAISPQAQMITAILYRADNGNSSGSQMAAFQNVTIELSHTAFAPTTMGTDFALNITATPQQVFAGGVVLNACTSTDLGIAPWDTIQLTTPFAFDPSMGNLLIDITSIDSSGSNSTSWFPDTARTGGVTESYGMSGPFSANPREWPRMSISGFANSQGNRSGIGIGGTVDVLIGSGGPFGGGAAYSGFLMAALQPIRGGLDLANVGAPMNSLYVSNPSIFIPFQLQQGPIGGPRFALSIPVPNVSLLLGLQVHLQPVYQDMAANMLGFVTGAGNRVTLGDSNGHPVNQIGSNDPASTSGSFVFTSGILGGAVVRLSVQ